MNPKNTEYRIVWQKWSDPLGEDDLDFVTEEPPTSEEIEPVFYSEEGDEIDADPEDDSMQFYQKPTKVIMTPMGMIPYTDNTASNKIFNFWLGHTNFDLTEKVCYMIEGSEGIETLDIFTRYRFRIGVGKLFDAGIVMSQISNKIYEHLSLKNK